MSYIGNQPSQIAFVSDQFSGNGSTTVFTMSVAPANTASALVVISGVTQDPSTYSVSGTTLTFSAAPPSGTANISVRYLGIPASGVTTTAYRTKTEFTATSGQTTFTPPSYTAGFIDVFRNGVLLGSADYTASNGTTVVLTTGANAGDLITTESFYVSSVLNAIPATTGAISLNGSYVSGILPQANGGSGQSSMGICQAWANFNSSSGSAVIRASYNVSSITVSSTGLYYLSFTNPLVDANYALMGAVSNNSGSTSNVPYTLQMDYRQSSTQGWFSTGYNTGDINMPFISVAIFR